MLVYFFYFACNLAFKTGGYGMSLGGLLSLPYPELGVTDNVVAEETERIIAAIERNFASESDILIVRNAVTILSDIAMSFNTPTPQIKELDILSKMMQTKNIESSVANMKIFVEELPKSPYLKASIRVYKAYVDLISRAETDFKSTEIARRVNGANLLFNAFSMYRGHISNFFDLVKIND
jgi:hypothetical protein